MLRAVVEVVEEEEGDVGEEASPKGDEDGEAPWKDVFNPPFSSSSSSSSKRAPP